MAKGFNAPTLKKQKGDAYKLSKADQKKHYEINLDIDDMIKYAQPARKNGRDAILGYMAISPTPKQGRSNIFPPTIHALLYSRISMEAANIPNIEYKHRLGASEPKMKWINAARKNAEAGDTNLRPHAVHLWMNQNFDKILLGVGFRYLSYLVQTRIIKINVNGKTVEKKMVVYDDVWDENLDFFHTGVSRDMLPGMFQGRACYFDRFFPRDVFLEKFDNELYQNISIVKNSDWFQKNDFIRVRSYYDLYRDLFYMQACQKDPFEGGDENGEYSMPIRDDFIQDYGPEDRPKKFLPVTSIHNDINFDMKQESEFNILQAGRQYAETGAPTNHKTFWSKSDPYLVRALVGAKNVMWRAGIDNAKASTVNFLLAQSNGVYDQIKTADLYGVVPLRSADGKSFDVKSLMANSDFLAKWQGADDMTDNAMIYALGNDYKRIAGQLTEEKATIAAIRNNVQQVRGKFNMKFNESGPIPRHYRILLNLIQQYYPEETMIWLSGAETLPKGLPESQIKRNLDGQPIGYTKPKMIPFDEQLVEMENGKNDDGSQKYKLVSANHPDVGSNYKARSSMFPARKQYIISEEEPEIFIEPGSTFEELKALEKSLEMEKLQVYMQLFGLVYPDGTDVQPGQPPATKPLIPKEGAEYIIKQFAEVFGDEPDKVIPPDAEAAGAPPKAQPPWANKQQAAMPGAEQAPQQSMPGQQPAQAVQGQTPMSQASQLRGALTP